MGIHPRSSRPGLNPRLRDGVVHTRYMAPRSPFVHVLGAGPTGSLTAFALAQKGYQVVLHDPQTAHNLQSRSRAYAITHSSRRLLDGLGLWSPLKPALTGFEALELRDDASSDRVCFSRSDLNSINTDQGTIGWILDHRPLMR